MASGVLSVPSCPVPSRPVLSLALGSLWLLLFVNTGCRTDKSTGGDGTLIEDLDGDGVAADLDCDDNDATVYPGAEELCDGLDNDCNTLIDDDATGATTWYSDGDGDGYGDGAVSQLCCAQPDGYVSDHTDCDDTDASVSPAADEVCDGVDNDCDGTVDIGARDESTYYLDADSDGYGVDTTTTTACSTPRGYADAMGDCDDAVATTNPGAAEICGNGVDDDCSGAADEGCPLEHCGTISSDETWDASITHHVTCDVYVQGSSRPTLSIADGALVEFDPGVGLYVGSGDYGDLQATGTSAGITMTSSEASPVAGDWLGIYLGYYDNGSYLEGTTVEYGGGDGYGCLFSYYSDPELNGVTAQSCDNAGFYVHSGSYPLVYDSTFQDNATYGVYVLDSAGLDSSGGPTFTGNTLTGNGSASIRLPANYVGQLGSTSSFAGNGTDWIEVAGDYVTTDATWQALDTDYEVMSDIYIQDTTSPLLTLDPGVLIGFDSGADLFVGTGNYGGLDATGTAAASITFTSSDLVSPAQGDWGGIYLGYYAVDSVTTLDYTTVEYGGSNGYGDIFLYYCDGSVTNSSVTDSSHYGIYRLASSPTISGVTYTNNASGDLY